jgi:hypothetical protein
MKPTTIVSTTFVSAVIAAIVVSLSGPAPATEPAKLPTTAAAGHPTTDPADDPRLGLAAFYDAVRKGDEKAAFDSWYDDCTGADERAGVEDLVHHLNAEMIAAARLEGAVRQMLHDEFENRRKAGELSLTPGREQLLSCRYVIYRRLAICQWSDDEDDGFPMVLDNSGKYQGKPSVWKISMQQWHETTKSSVGDSMLASGWGVKAKNLTADEVLSGKYKTFDEVESGCLKHMKEIMEADDATTRATATAPVR